MPIPPKYAEFFSNTKSIGKNIKSNIEEIEQKLDDMSYDFTTFSYLTLFIFY